MENTYTSEDVRRSELRVNRTLLLVGGTLFPLMGLAYMLQTPEAEVHMGFRLSFAAVCFGFLIWSFYSDKLQRNLWMLIYFLSYLATFKVIHLLYQNNLAPLFVLGLVVMMFSVSIVFRTPRHVAYYYSTVILLTTILAYSLKQPEMEPLVPTICLLIVSLMGYVVLSSRLILLRELLRSSELAMSSAKAKSEFLANMSHEIRTPMNGVVGMTELLLDSELSDKQTELAETVRYSAEYLVTVINDVLDFSKLDAGKVTLSPVPFEVAAFVERLETVFRYQCDEKEIQLVTEIGKDVPSWVEGDTTRLQQVLNNLIGNAVKFTPRGGAVLIFVDREEGELDTEVTLRFSVVDSGIGIPKERQEAVFEAFTQADASTTREYGGTGLGLAIASKLVSLMGGEIELHSKPNVGTVFSFTSVLPSVDEENVQVHLNEKASTEKRRSAIERSLRVLLAEDNAINQKVATRFLEKEGHSVRVVANGLEAVAATKEESFDVILMDMQMPLMGGEQATSIIRTDNSEAEIPIVALTANAMAGDREKYLALGMNGYVSKPINRTTLFQVINQASLRKTPPQGPGVRYPFLPI